MMRMRGGFPRAIRAGDGVAPSGEERDGDVLKENLGAVAHRDIIERQQER